MSELFLSILFYKAWIIIGVLWLWILASDIWCHKESLMLNKHSFALSIIKKYWWFIILGIILVGGTKPRNVSEREKEIHDNYKVFLEQGGQVIKTTNSHEQVK